MKIICTAEITSVKVKQHQSEKKKDKFYIRWMMSNEHERSITPPNMRIRIKKLFQMRG
jgi:hypothetical protein